MKKQVAIFWIEQCNEEVAIFWIKNSDITTAPLIGISEFLMLKIYFRPIWLQEYNSVMLTELVSTPSVP
jgi:hypothetical protein